MRKFLAVLCGLFLLSGCAAESVWAPDDVVQRSIYRHDGPPRLTLFTMINNNSGAGAHTSLMINGSQRVIFDPAGSFKHDSIPERNDVVFGVTPIVEDVYTRYHARESFRVKVQSLDVSPELAEAVMRAAMEYGAVPPAQCSLSTSTILANFFPGQISRGWYPRKLADQFGEIPGVTTRELREYDSDDNTRVLEDWDPNRVARDAVSLLE
jgi:hypothetical protein